jgi:hypothetical protein
MVFNRSFKIGWWQAIWHRSDAIAASYVLLVSSIRFGMCCCQGLNTWQAHGAPGSPAGWRCRSASATRQSEHLHWVAVLCATCIVAPSICRMN